jgi:hypothetical protein
MPAKGRWDDDLLALIRVTGHLCLQVDDPSWEDARRYLFDESAMTLYFPVAKKYLGCARVAGGANGVPNYHRHPWPRASSSVPSATRTIP